MPPFASPASSPDYAGGGAAHGAGGSHVVTLNVGGQLFQTTAQTLALAGPDSILASLALSAVSPNTIPFLDRDPDLFSALLSFLRSGRLPCPKSSTSSALDIDLDDLLAEARFYALAPDLLLAPLADPSLFDPYALRRTVLLPLPGRDPPSAISAGPSDLLVAHGGKISSFDPSLRRRATALTPLPVVDSLLSLASSPLAAAGATDFPGLHLLDLRRGGAVLRVLSWSPHPAPNGATVQAIEASPDLLFGSFESSRRNASSILAFDLETFRPVVEIGRREIYGADLEAAIPATNLQWLPGFNLLMASGSHRGPFGLLGNIRLWDVRSGEEAVFEVNEKGDCFADITVSDSLAAMFKVGFNSGEVFMADIRKLSGVGEPWVCISEGRSSGNGKKEGSGCRIESHGRHVFCSRGGDVEMWSEVLMGSSAANSVEDGLVGDRVMRRNLMGGVKDLGGKKIGLLGFGGNRMILARKDEQCVEVWDSSSRG